jgi:hypothetical protein
MATLLYSGGSTLTFGSGRDRRTIKNGEPFEVSDTLAMHLLADPHISLAPAAEASGDAGADVPRETSLVTKTKAELQAIAAELGLELPKRATNAELVASIEAEQTRLADEAALASGDGEGEGDEGGEDAPGDDPTASADGEPGTPPSSTGAVTLGDLPAGAKVR